MWMVYGLLAGALLGFYDFWTKKAMIGNSVLPVVFWSSVFGALCWLPPFIALGSGSGALIDITATSASEQAVIMIKGIAMTGSWILAYYAVRELPISFAGAVRASGPLWTMAGGVVIFGEILTPLQFFGVVASVLAYYLLSVASKREGISVLRSLPMLTMLLATLLSAMTTVYDKFIVHRIGLLPLEVQAYSAAHRSILAGIVLAASVWYGKSNSRLNWHWSLPLVGISWVGAEWIYFFAIEDPQASVTYLSIFRRMSLVVGFILSALLLGETNLLLKTAMIATILAATVLLLVTA